MMEPSEEQFLTYPIFLVVDASASMAGAPIHAVNSSLRELQNVTEDDPLIAEIASICVVTVGDDTRVVLPLGDFAGRQLQEVVAHGRADFGAAFRGVRQVINDALGSLPRGTRIWRPLILFFSDGKHETDGDWRSALADLHDVDWKWHPEVIALGVGDDVDHDTLAEIATRGHFGAAETTPAQVFTQLMRNLLSAQPSEV